VSVLKRWNESTEEWEVAVVGKTGPVGPTGATGPAGATGASGTGVIADGAQGQVLAKLSATSYDTEWVTATPFKSAGTSYVFPAGMGIGTLFGYSALSSTPANSAGAMLEIVFDVGNHNTAAVSFTFEVQTTNNGAGAAAAVALYELTTPTTRTFIRDCGTATIGTAGVKRITFTSTLVPRYVSALFTLRNINNGGSNPTFAVMGTYPPFRYMNQDTMFSGFGNNASTYVVAGSNPGTSWPGTLTMGSFSAGSIVGILGVQA
jgi:hypothetical protein